MADHVRWDFCDWELLKLAKNLVLMGVASLTIHDPKVVTIADLSSQVRSEFSPFLFHTYHILTTPLSSPLLFLTFITNSRIYSSS